MAENAIFLGGGTTRNLLLRLRSRFLTSFGMTLKIDYS
jgi:peptidase E